MFFFINATPKTTDKLLCKCLLTRDGNNTAITLGTNFPHFGKDCCFTWYYITKLCISKVKQCCGGAGFPSMQSPNRLNQLKLGIIRNVNWLHFRPAHSKKPWRWKAGIQVTNPAVALDTHLRVKITVAEFKKTRTEGNRTPREVDKRLHSVCHNTSGQPFQRCLHQRNGLQFGKRGKEEETKTQRWKYISTSMWEGPNPMYTQ